MRGWRLGRTVRAQRVTARTMLKRCDHSIRLYSTKKLKSLGTLEYHKSGCFALAFAYPVALGQVQGDEEFEPDELVARGFWLASGGKDSRMCIWPLNSFEKKKKER